MLRNTIQSNFVRRFFKTSTSTRPNSTGLNTKRILLASVVGSIAYDGYNEFEICGGISRFLRSLQIAVQISIDYSWNLYGVSENDEGYDEVIIDIFFHIELSLFILFLLTIQNQILIIFPH